MSSMSDRDRKILLAIIPIVLVVAYWFLLLAPKREAASQASKALTEQTERRDNAKAQAELARGAETPRALDLVVVDSPPDDRFAVVESDHAGGAHAATVHLLSLSHETVWHLGGPESSYAAASLGCTIGPSSTSPPRPSALATSSRGVAASATYALAWSSGCSPSAPR